MNKKFIKILNYTIIILSLLYSFKLFFSENYSGLKSINPVFALLFVFCIAILYAILAITQIKEEGGAKKSEGNNFISAMNIIKNAYKKTPKNKKIGLAIALISTIIFSLVTLFFIYFA